MSGKKPEIEILEGRIKKIRNLVKFLSLLCFILAVISGVTLPWLKIALWFPGWQWFLYGILLAILTFWLSGYVVVQAPERIVIERFGKPVRILEPGLRWKIPIFETIRARPKVYERSLEIFASQPKIDFRDGSATLKNPRIYIELSERENDIKNAIYRVRNWSQWVVDTVEPIIRGYLNTLSITEALDQGGARGNLIDRLRDRPDITKKQLNAVKKEIRVLNQKIEEEKGNKEEARFFKVKREKDKDEERDLRIRLADQKQRHEEFENFLKEAQERGIKKIHRIVVAEFGLSPEVIKAREKIHEEEKKAIASLSEAIRETTMRTGPIIRTKEELIKAGFPEGEASRMAYELEILGTLAKTGSLFLTGEKATIPKMAAIFAEVARRRDETRKKQTKKKKPKK